uniref:Uncharacterized protein n=1 Tax=Rhodopseudomonas palustris (strain DX-1) TaxID=652103 RepID=E6VMK0_RHOPX
MDQKYLIKQYNIYSVVVEVPKRLQAKAGRKRFKKSLGVEPQQVVLGESESADWRL